MVKEGKYTRLGGKFLARWGVWALVLVLVAGILTFVLVLRKPSVLNRTTVVLVGDPVVVWSKDHATGRISRITLPKDAVIEGTHGLGMYSLDSLWRLGSMDRSDESVLAESLGEALGIPMPWFIGPKNGGGVQFTPRAIVSYLRAGYRTNVSLGLLVSLIVDSLRQSSADGNEIAVTPGAGLISQTLPDGSDRLVLDTATADSRLAGMFEDERLRRERLSVAVYNTTQMPTLGNRAGRLLGHLGSVVVRVGNDTADVDRCTIAANRDHLASVTVQVIAELFDCSTREADTDVADVEVRVGDAYEAKFLPRQL